MTPVVLQPLKVTRIGIAVSGGLIALGAAAVVVLAGRLGAEWVVMGAVTLVAGVLMAVRGRNVAVVLERDHALIRGLLWSRAVPRDAVVEISAFPSIRWRDGQGRVRSSPVNALNTTSGASGPIRENAEHGKDLLRRWAAGQDVSKR